MTRDAATLAQLRASAPERSVWLSANAGSGKTRVLTDRVARLLFDGVPPAHILCLTYTKAAASEMQNRLFARLGEWAMLEDAPLRDALFTLGIEDELPTDRLAHARRLFALAIETPGGLRIQTIHSFCAALLRRFPLEAGVSPQFTEIEDRAADLLRADILEKMSSGPEAELVANLARHFSEPDFSKLTRDIVARRQDFEPDVTEECLFSRYGVEASTTEADLANAVFTGDTLSFLGSVATELLASSKTTDAKRGEHLTRVKTPDSAGLTALEGALLTKTGQIPKTLVTKDLAEGPLAWAMPRLEALSSDVEAARNNRLALAAARRDVALYRFAERFLPQYETAKQLRGWLDFDDLIDRTRALLGNDTVAAWVLYRLDGGIDHILVDEAQDTSPRQWQVIESLAQEFKAGVGARDDVVRTIFVVGDKKQSIYSFQGADPGEFDRMREDFGKSLQHTSVPLFSMTLEYSFRSSDAVLQVVDRTFRDRSEAGFSQDNKHIAFKDDLPGRVDLWPFIQDEKPKDPDEDDWYRPLDRKTDDHHTVVLARRIAGFIRDTIAKNEPIPAEKDSIGQYKAKAAKAGDFLILVRSRSRLFHEIIRACKQADLPIAGADRLKVMGELAVRDLGALLAFLATPEDNHSLAVALRSPLFGLSEQELFDLAARRGKRYLWEVLREKTADLEPVLDVLNDLMAQTDFLRPYDLLERILVRHRGRERLLGRLGDEAEDGIDALLSQALSYEQTEVPSLTGFLQWMHTDDLEIKRQLEGAGDRIRVMTIHGAKGLEAPIVILPDCAVHRNTNRDMLMTGPQGVYWRATSAEMPKAQREMVELAADAQKREADRLLYVAMTRAEKWLIVAGAGKLNKEEDTWYQRISNGMTESGAVSRGFSFVSGDAGTGQRLETGNWGRLNAVGQPVPSALKPGLPAHFMQKANPVDPQPEVLTPSDLGGAKALPGPDNDDEEAAKRRGRLVHLLLEHLADVEPGDRESACENILRVSGEDVCQSEIKTLLGEVQNVLDAPELAPFFASNTLAEVPLTAQLPQLNKRKVFGVIDRLIVLPDSVLAVDFKSNQTVPSDPEKCPEGILRQMGAYAAMLALIYPDRRVDTGVVWTANASYMPLPAHLVAAALNRVSVP